MKHLLRKLHLGSNHADHLDGARAADARPASSGTSRATNTEVSSGDQRLSVPSSLSGWLTSVGRQVPSINYNQGATGGNLRSREGMSEAGMSGDTLDGPRSGGVATAGSSAIGSFGEVANEMDFRSLEEEYQVQLAMAISASNNEQRLDPEILEIEAVKRISLGLSPSSATAQAQVMTYRYWTYNYLGYEDHVVDGFYDVYGITESTMTERMPTLSDLQALPVIDTITYEVVLVNRATDPDLVDLEQRALLLANDCRGTEVGYRSSDLVESLAHLVAGHMGGSVANDIDMLTVWRTTSWALKTSLHNIVLPLGRLSVGLARHRALLFKVLADRVGISCRLVKGRHYTGVDEGALNIIKGDDDREYIVDLVGDPGTLIPPDVSGFLDPLDSFASMGALACREDGTPAFGSSLRHPVESVASTPEHGSKDLVSPLMGKRAGVECVAVLPCGSPTSPPESSLDNTAVCRNRTSEMIEQAVMVIDSKSGNWTCSQCNESIGFDAMHILPHNCRRGYPCPEWRLLMSSGTQEVKDLAPNLLAGFQKPEMAHKLHDVLLESLVVTPSEGLLPEFLNAEGKMDTEGKEISGNQVGPLNLSHSDDMQPALASKYCLHTAQNDILQDSWSLDLVGEKRLLSIASPLFSPGPAVVHSVQQCVQHDLMAPSTAAVTTSALIKPATVEVYRGCNVNIHGPFVALSTATLDLAPIGGAAAMTDDIASCSYLMAVSRREADGHRESNHPENTRNRTSVHGTGGQVADGQEGDSSLQEERSSTADHIYFHELLLDDVAEWEIPWEDIVMGERIGLGSYGEVYHGDWHGSEVAVKKFLDQDLSGDALEEFRSEVRIMKRLRHPNVVLFMGAVTRAPNLSIVTEFLPRGSLYRLIHRPNNQLDERRRLRMALDVAKGMNYLHSCTPLIVHRDLKSPNLLVDKNWVVKVCDFGLSRMKHHTFLSSKSTAGTPEWMAPEVLRNEPSNEKSDVYSFGVILWELATLKQPWGGMNPMQVVGAVGFQHRRLDISDHMDPVIGRIIRECWQNDPNMRPSFSQLMNALKPLQRPILSSQPDNLRQSGSIVYKQAHQEPVHRQQAGRRSLAR